jgi:hypothetical protein
MQLPLRISALAVLLLVNPPRPVVAMDRTGYYAVVGVGNKSCGSYVDARRHDDDLYYGAWLGGYLTAKNYDVDGLNNLIEGTDLNGVELWIENYCKSRPTATFAGAVAAFAKSQR